MFLLDTHTLIWFLDNDSRLPLGTKQQIESAEAVCVSIVSIWEIAIKINIGKLLLKTNFQAIEQNLIEQDISILSIDIAAFNLSPYCYFTPFSTYGWKGYAIDWRSQSNLVKANRQIC